MRKTIGIIILLGYMAVLIAWTAAEFYKTSHPQKACALNPLVADYWYRYFQQTKDLKSLEKAIDREPLKPFYHMYYGLELIREYDKRTRSSDELAFSEIKKAHELKPYSKTYQEIYERYARLFKDL